MRRAALVLLVTLGSSIAIAQAPPSKTLERAIKLYDVKDFFSSTIEAKKVIDGETGDTADNVARARFFMAKSFFQMKFYVPAFVVFGQIIQENGTYRSISFKWIAGLRKSLPDTVLVSALATLTPQDLDDPSLVAARDDLLEIQKARTAAVDLHAISRDALGCTHPDPARMRELVEKLRGYEDNAELTAALRLALRDRDNPGPRAIDLAMTKAPNVLAARDWVRELRDELELLNKSDRAWQTTMVAAEILQELTIQFSVGEADLGARVRELLDAMQPEIATVGSYATPRDRCTQNAPPTLAGSPTSSSPMVVDPPRNGCACATGGSPKDGALLVVLLAFVLRRKSRAASRTRSPRA